MRRQPPQPERTVDASSPAVPVTARRFAAHRRGASRLLLALALVAPVAAFTVTLSLFTQMRRSLVDDLAVVDDAYRASVTAQRLGFETRPGSEAGPERVRDIARDAEEFAIELDRMSSRSWRHWAHTEAQRREVDKTYASLRAEWAASGAPLASAEAPLTRADSTRLIERITGHAPALARHAALLARHAEHFHLEQESDHLGQLFAVAAVQITVLFGLFVAVLLQMRRMRRDESELRRLATIARHNTNGLALADRDGNVEWVNDALPELTGWSREWLTGRSLQEILSPGTGEASPRHGGFSGTEAFRATAQVRTFDGPARWFEVEVTPLPGPSGEVEQIVGVFRDVHDRVEATRSRLESEERFRTALAAMSDGLVLQGRDGSIELSNASAERILGLTADQLAGRNPFDPRWRAVHEDGTEFPGSEHPGMRSLKTGESFENVVMGVCRPSGQLVWVSISSRPVHSSDRGEIVGSVSTFTDITARRAAEDLVRKLSSAVAQSPALVIISDSAGNMEYVNDRIEPMLGYRRDEVVGRNPRMFTSGETPAEVYASMWSTLLAGHEWRGEIRNRRKDGRIITIALSIFPLRDERGVVTHYVATEQDVTDQRAREKELARAREDALAAVRAKSEFLQNMSHELRTPMNGILGTAELLLGGELSCDQRADLLMLKRSAEQLTAAIGQIFDFTRLEAGATGGTTAASELFRLPACVRDVHAAFASPAEARGVAWRLEMDDALPDSVVGDPGGLRQVLRNLLDNAIKFTDQGTVTLRVALATAAAGTDDHVRFTVADTGVGIAAERQASIFEAFQQADTSSTRRYGGIGLGLTIAAQIVRRMGGRLEVNSTPGKGSEFGFTLAFRRAGADDASPRSAPPVTLGAHVLVLDAGATARTGIVAALQRAGADAEVASGIPEASESLRRALAEGRPYRVLVYEQRAGGVDAFATAGELRRAFGPALPPAMMLTSSGQRGDAGRCQELGIHAYLAEPVDDGMVGEALARMLAADPAAPGALVTRHLLRESRPVVRVLLVDDNAVNRKVASRLLERSGCKVEQAVNGRDAVGHWSAGEFDVVLMDIQMPEMDGLEATRAIRRIEQEKGRSRTPVIALTAHTLDDDRREVTAAGMDDFVAKPIQADVLLAALRRVTAAVPGTIDEDAAPPGLREVMDWDEALARMDGDEGVLAEILALFLQDAPRMLRTLEEARQSGDVHRIERAAHGLKGASATISARTVAPLAREVEQHAREGRLTEAVDGMDDLRRELHRLVRALEALPDAGRKAA